MKEWSKNSMSASKSKNKKYRPHYWVQYLFYAIMKPLLYIVIRFGHNVHFVRNGYQFPRGAFLVISNHHNNWDPFYLNFFMFKRIPHFIANEEVFYNKFTAFLAGIMLGQIKRGMTFTDLGYFRILQRYVQDGKVVGVYPEGDISMFGDTLPVDISIAKLAKMLKIPVVCTRVTGGHLRSPRVAKFARHSRITYAITDLIGVDEINKTPLDTLYKRMHAGIVHSENTWQKSANVKTGARHLRAKWLEIGFFWCPQCHQFESFYSRDNELYCRNCNFHLHANRYYRFDYPDDPNNTYPHLENSSDFNARQIVALEEHIAQFSKNNPLVWTVDNIRYHQAANHHMFKHHYDVGRFLMYVDHLDVINTKGVVVYHIMWRDIISTMVQYKDVFEIKLPDYRLRLYKKKGTWNGYLYVETLKRLLRDYQ